MIGTKSEGYRGQDVATDQFHCDRGHHDILLFFKGVEVLNSWSSSLFSLGLLYVPAYRSNGTRKHHKAAGCIIWFLHRSSLSLLCESISPSNWMESVPHGGWWTSLFASCSLDIGNLKLWQQQYLTIQWALWNLLTRVCLLWTLKPPALMNPEWWGQEAQNPPGSLWKGWYVELLLSGRTHVSFLFESIML